jgi:CRP-like cAMP-binding protein
MTASPDLPRAPRRPATTPADAASAIDRLLRDSSRPTRAALVEGARLRRFTRHDVVAAQGDDSLVILVVGGHLGGWRSDPGGRRHMVRLAGPGALVNVVAMERIPSVVDLVGLDDGMVALWPGDLVQALARRDAGLGLDLLRLALAGADTLLRRIDGMAFDSVTRRLARILWEHRELLFGERPLLSRPELADLAGATREMTGRVIRDFERRGLVARHGAGGLVLLDGAALRAEAGIDDGGPVAVAGEGPGKPNQGRT